MHSLLVGYTGEHHVEALVRSVVLGGVRGVAGLGLEDCLVLVHAVQFVQVIAVFKLLLQPHFP